MDGLSTDAKRLALDDDANLAIACFQISFCELFVKG
jgi:hypothetical protein